jgi:hypothetical protein
LREADSKSVARHEFFGALPVETSNKSSAVAVVAVAIYAATTNTPSDCKVTNQAKPDEEEGRKKQLQVL